MLRRTRLFVRAGRLELPPLSRPGPKPGASASSATLAHHKITLRRASAPRRPVPARVVEVCMGKQIPIVDYLVIDDGEPHLTAWESADSGALYFDRRNADAK